MNLHKVIARFSAAPEDPQELRRIARALGQEFPRERLDILNGFRAEIARMRSPHDAVTSTSDFAAGYMEGMLDITAEYEVTVREHSDIKEYEETTVNEGWRDILALLRDGHRLPSAIADSLGVDRSSVTRSLQKMQAAGVVEVTPGDPLDGRTRPHRLTLEGRRLLERLERDLIDDMVHGIQVAVALVSHVMRHAASPASDLLAVAFTILGDESAAAKAVETWTKAFTDHGMLHDTRSSAQHTAPSEATPAKEPPRVSSGAPWHRAPLVLARVRRSPEEAPVPLYVRTTDDAWPAWAFALTQDQDHRQSRAIVDGDILTRTIHPPDQPFHLVYDDLSAISADREDPTMRDLMSRADEKFVVAYSDDELADVPSDFVAIAMAATNAAHP